MKVNVGCGEDLRAGWVNVDARDDCGADVVADIHHLPFADQSASQVLALDILEHVHDPLPVLAEWHRILRPEGRLTVRVPNLHALAVQIAYWHDKPGRQLTALLMNVYGGHKWGDFDTHHWGFTPASLAATLDTARFATLSNDVDLNMTVEAVRL